MTEKEWRQEKDKIRYHERKAQGVCVKCGIQDAYTFMGRSLCADCADKENKRVRKAYSSRKEKILEYNKNKYNQRKENSICVDCGKRKAVKGETRCIYCKNKSNKSKQKARGRIVLRRLKG